MPKLWLCPHSPYTNFILGAALSGNAEKAAELCVEKQAPEGMPPEVSDPGVLPEPPEERSEPRWPPERLVPRSE